MPITEILQKNADIYPNESGFEYQKNATALVWDNEKTNNDAWFVRYGYTFAGWNTKADGTVVEPKDILYDRLEDTSIPVNSVAVTPHTAEGYIDVVYFSDRTPIDACIEYVRPLGMYCFQNAGVRMDARTKISIDARLIEHSTRS